MVVVSQGWNVGGVFGVGPSVGVAWLLALVEVAAESMKDFSGLTRWFGVRWLALPVVAALSP